MHIKEKKETIYTITLAKGIAIILVVIGHYFPESSPPYWTSLRDFIYLFHMPLFFILSGFLFQFSCIKDINVFPVFIFNKTKRLMLPFLTIAVIFLFVKIITGFFIPLKFPVTLSSILQLFINPAESFVPLLWFIYTLFFIQLLFQGIQLLLKNTFFTFIISLLIMFIPVPGHIFVFYIFLDLPFFIIGYIFALYFLAKKENPDTISVKVVIVSSIICLVCTFFFLRINQFSCNNIVLSRIIRFIIGTSLSISCIGLASLLVRIRHLIFIKILYLIGSSAMGIYLLHIFFQSFIRICFQRFFPLNLPFIIPAILAIISGIICPLLIEHFILRRFKLTRRLILGSK